MTAKRSRMFRRYMLRLAGRIIILLCIFYIYLFHRPQLEAFVDFRLLGPVTPLHLLWGILMAGMLLHLLPRARITMGGRKSRAETYAAPPQGYDRLQLLEYVQLMNIRAWRVMLAWIFFSAVFGALYLCDIIGNAEMIMLSMLYFVGDLVCILIFCPFQTFFMGNRCCVNCRIFDWGHFMMYTPMLFIPSFFSWSLFFTACVVLIRWELAYAKHPERFWRGSNLAIRCENCADRICRIKKPLNTAFGGKQADSEL